ncbi:MAG TPA: rhomboid family intramembrane serine protease [Solirubrobacteraceae bacterium]|nr:rhomboid family intramembrane serine protease [Solirubrobacteraceae bacterium]
MIPLKDNIKLARVPLVTIALILANVIAYLVAIGHGGSIIGGPSAATIARYGAIPYELSHWGQHCALGLAALGETVLCTGQAHVTGSAGAQPATWETPFTGMFLHANILHIAGNMLFLAVFGPTVEDRIGRVRYLGFYLLGGLAALALQVAVDPSSSSPTLGASGAIAAVLGAYILLYPRARILTVVILIFFFTIVDLPAWTMLVLWLAFDGVLGALGITTPFGGGAGVAYYAHIGGFAFGLLVALALVRQRPTPAGPAAPLPA